LGGVFIAFNRSCEGKLPLDHIVAVYDFFENMMEQLLDDITAMMVNLTCTDTKVRLNIQMGCQEEIAQQVLADVTIPYGRFTYEIMDEDVVIDLTISKEVDAG
jgi:hypothetical protein